MLDEPNLKMSSKFGKRPLRSLSAHEKMDAIRRVHDGESKASVARDIGVPESTLRGWCKNEDKILYLSRQSTPETDDSEPKEKRQKFDPPTLLNGTHEPYNLSVKIDTDLKPAPEIPVPKMENGSALNLTKDQISPKISSNGHMSERERNRAELARLSVELGLNRPEMFLPMAGNQSQLGLTDNLMAQWNNAITQIVNSTNKVSSKLRHSLPAQNLLQSPIVNSVQHLPKTASKPKVEKLEPQQNVDDSVWQWLKTQQAMLGLMSSQNPSQNGGAVDPNGSWFWKWYKQFAYTPQQAQDSNVLYQQLTKDPSNTENHQKLLTPEKPKTPNTKARAVLDNLLLNNNNNEVPTLPNSNDFKDKIDPKDEVLSPSEALEHGEKFLKWLEAFSDPSVTAMQVLQFRYLLNNIKSCTDRKNTTPEVPKLKVKRK